MPRSRVSYKTAQEAPANGMKASMHASLRCSAKRVESPLHPVTLCLDGMPADVGAAPALPHAALGPVQHGGHAAASPHALRFGGRGRRMGHQRRSPPGQACSYPLPCAGKLACLSQLLSRFFSFSSRLRRRCLGKPALAPEWSLGSAASLFRLLFLPLSSGSVPPA